MRKYTHNWFAKEIIECYLIRNGELLLIWDDSDDKLYSYSTIENNWVHVIPERILTDLVDKFINKYSYDDNMYVLEDYNFMKSVWEIIKMRITWNTMQFIPMDLSENNHKLKNKFPGFKGKLTGMHCDDLKFLLSYIKSLWGDGVFDDIMKWLAYPLKNYKKNNQTLVIEKNIDADLRYNPLIEFFMKYVYGNKICLMTDDENCDIDEKMLVCITKTNVDRNLKLKKLKSKYTSFIVVRHVLEEDFIFATDRKFLLASENIYNCNLETPKMIERCFNKDVGNMFYTYLINL